MSIDTSRALVPVQSAIQPIAAVEHKEINLFRRHNRDRDGVIFIGYGKNGVDGNYGPFGKKLKEEINKGMKSLYRKLLA